MTGRQHRDPTINVFIRHIDYNFLTSKKTADIRMASHDDSCVKDLMFSCLVWCTDLDTLVLSESEKCNFTLSRSDDV